MFLYYTKTQSCFRFHKELTNVFLDIRKLGRCVKVHRVEKPVSLFSCASCKIWSLVCKMLFFVDRHIYASFLCGFTIKWLLQTFPSHCLFCSDKELQKLPGKRMRNARAKRCAPSKIVLISGLGNKVFQLFTEMTNLAAKVQLVTLCKHPQPWSIRVWTNFGVCACV